MFCAGLRDGQRPLSSSARVSSSRKRPFSTSLTLSNSTPSSSIRVEKGGIDPGVVPPMSAWWPREPT